MLFHISLKILTLLQMLSRRDGSTSFQCFVLSIPFFDFLTTLITTFQIYRTFTKKFNNPKNIQPTLKAINDILYHKGRPFLSKNSSLKNLFLQEFHSTLEGGHAGINKTLQSLQANAY